MFLGINILIFAFWVIITCAAICENTEMTERKVRGILIAGFTLYLLTTLVQYGLTLIIQNI